MFDDFLEHFKTRAQRKFHGRIRDDHVLEKDYQPKPILPDETYFEIRLAEMFLSHKSEYGRSFIPLAVAASEFSYAGNRQIFPFFVGNDLLRDIDSYVKNQDITFHGTRVVGPAVYHGDDVAFFIGLFRIEVDDFARKLLEVLAQTISIFDVSRLSSYIDVAGKLTEGLYSLLNFKQIECRIGDRRVFQEHGDMLFKDGYFVYMNCDEDAVSLDDLWVRDGELKKGLSADSIQSFNEYDFCLVQIQSSDTRKDCTSFAFHEMWKHARNLIWNGNEALAHTIFIDCCRQIGDSCDLVPKHAEALIQAYEANYAKEVERYARLRGKTSGATPTVSRGANGISLSPRQRIIRTAQVAANAGVNEKALQPLIELSENWKRVPHVESAGEELTDELLDKQVASIRCFSSKRASNPKALAEALAIAAVTAA